MKTISLNNARRLRVLEWTLAGAGCFLLGAAAVQQARLSLFQAYPSWFVTRVGTRQVEASTPEAHVNVLQKQALQVSGTISHTSNNELEIMGRLEIPRLHVSLLVVEGADEESLAVAPGHVPGTAPLGSFGNTAIAGHRDTVFRILNKVHAGDSIVVRKGSTALQYAVNRMSIVSPSDVSVLADDGGSKLTLITCYPFYFVGNAPHRFVIQARLVAQQS